MKLFLTIALTLFLSYICSGQNNRECKDSISNTYLKMRAKIVSLGEYELKTSDYEAFKNDLQNLHQFVSGSSRRKARIYLRSIESVSKVLHEKEKELRYYNNSHRIIWDLIEELMAVREINSDCFVELSHYDLKIDELSHEMRRLVDLVEVEISNFELARILDLEKHYINNRSELEENIREIVEKQKLLYLENQNQIDKLLSYLNEYKLQNRSYNSNSISLLESLAIESRKLGIK